MQLTRLALLADDAATVAACALQAVHHLRGGPAVKDAQLGLAAIDTLDRHHETVPINLLRVTGDAALTSGDGQTGQRLLDRSVRQVEAGGPTAVDPLDRARVLAEQGRRLFTSGQPDRADQLLRQAFNLFTKAKSDGEAAAVMGDLADIAYRRGDLDEALRIRTEVQLPMYERLGDIRETAVAWGRVADIAHERGDLDEALRIRTEVELPVYERLGDVDGIANTKWAVAQIRLAEKDYKSALTGLVEAYTILGQLRRPDGIAVVGQTLGSLLLAAGRSDDARTVLTESLAAAIKIGQSDLAAILSQLLDQCATKEDE